MLLVYLWKREEIKMAKRIEDKKTTACETFRYTSECVALGLLLSGFLGCGSNDEVQRYRVTGAVTFDGKPVPFGSITFEPDFNAGNSGPQSAAAIVDGKYDTGVKDGLVGGPHVVRITGNNRAPTATQPNTELLFADYEVKENFEKASGRKDFSVPRDEKKSQSSVQIPNAKPLRKEQMP